MREPFNPYAHIDGPERDPSHSLDDWTTEGGRADRELDDAITQREANERALSAAIPDVYEVADRVLAPLVTQLRSVPRRLQAEVVEALERRGKKPTRTAQLAEAAIREAQERAAEDPEIGLALLLRAALLWRPEGGWQSHGPRDRREGFSSVKDLLGAAFTDLALGAGAIPLEIAQNRARTRSLPGEVFVQASHSGSSNARNATAIDRALDARSIIAKSRVYPGDIEILYAWRVVGLLQDDRALDPTAPPLPPAKSLLAALRQRHAVARGALLPPPPKGRPAHDDKPAQPPTAAETVEWMRVAGLSLHGPLAPTMGEAEERFAARETEHLRRADRALYARLHDAESVLAQAIGHTPRRGVSRRPPKPAPRPVERVRATLAAGCL